jgi:hypothetical protein
MDFEQKFENFKNSYIGPLYIINMEYEGHD